MDSDSDFLPPEHPQRLCAALHEYISNAQAMVLAGDYVALQGLDSHVSALCEAVTHLSRDQYNAYADELERIMFALDGLQKTFVEHRDHLQGSIAGLNHSQRAAKAYAKGSLAGAALDGNEEN